MRTHECPHTQGETVNGKVCHAILTDPADAYEWSFVAVPAQRNAGVSKSAKKTKTDYTYIDSNEPTEIVKSICKNSTGGCVALNPEQLKALSGYIARMESDAAITKQKRFDAEAETVALCAFTLPDADTKMLTSILKKLEDSEVFMLRKAFEMKAESAEAFALSLKGKNESDTADNSQFRI